MQLWYTTNTKYYFCIIINSEILIFLFQTFTSPYIMTMSNKNPKVNWWIQRIVFLIRISFTTIVLRTELISNFSEKISKNKERTTFFNWLFKTTKKMDFEMLTFEIKNIVSFDIILKQQTYIDVHIHATDKYIVKLCRFVYSIHLFEIKWTIKSG